MERTKESNQIILNEYSRYSFLMLLRISFLLQNNKEALGHFSNLKNPNFSRNILAWNDLFSKKCDDYENRILIFQTNNADGFFIENQIGSELADRKKYFKEVRYEHCKDRKTKKHLFIEKQGDNFVEIDLEAKTVFTKTISENKEKKININIKDVRILVNLFLDELAERKIENGIKMKSMYSIILSETNGMLSNKAKKALKKCCGNLLIPCLTIEVIDNTPETHFKYIASSPNLECNYAPKIAGNAVQLIKDRNDCNELDMISSCTRVIPQQKIFPSGGSFISSGTYQVANGENVILADGSNKAIKSLVKQLFKMKERFDEYVKNQDENTGRIFYRLNGLDENQSELSVRINGLGYFLFQILISLNGFDKKIDWILRCHNRNYSELSGHQDKQDEKLSELSGRQDKQDEKLSELSGRQDKQNEKLSELSGRYIKQELKTEKTKDSFHVPKDTTANKALDDFLAENINFKKVHKRLKALGYSFSHPNNISKKNKYVEYRILLLLIYDFCILEKEIAIEEINIKDMRKALLNSGLIQLCAKAFNIDEKKLLNNVYTVVVSPKYKEFIRINGINGSKII